MEQIVLHKYHQTQEELRRVVQDLQQWDKQEPEDAQQEQQQQQLVRQPQQREVELWSKFIYLVLENGGARKT